ncbi:MAG: hypothetical protein KC729_14315, partial [Candidatus Eisenbacteria bacterium]|nr:hypothetical protein [Candidatus Eisenbacteria bacterium]
MNDSNPKANPESWWRTLSVAEDRTVSFRIGPLHGWVTRSRLEWTLAHCYGDDEDESVFAFADPASDEPPEHVERERFPFRQTDPAIHFRPSLADLPVVIRPDDELFLPSGEEVRLFVTTPLWLVLSAGTLKRKMIDLPIRRPSETWFGPSTREGEVCYAARSRAKLLVTELNPAGVRAITAVHVRNRAPSPFALNRIKVPAPFLTLHESDDGRLWTETLSIERTEDAKTVAFEIGTGPPPEVFQARPLEPPRAVAERAHLLQSIGSFLRGR